MGIVSWMCMNTVIYAQLSPGDLTKAHANLEGISNCTKCHQLGATVVDSKCLECHAPLRNQIKNGKGYHSSAQVKGKTCISCHSEHHGRNFKMIRFNTAVFNHNLTGYKLEGKHSTTDCRQCHKPENITDASISKNRDTYLGLKTNCLNCHDDYHRKSLNSNCAACHTFENFSTAPRFNHARTKFPLTGAHTKVDCASCHKIESIQGKKFQNFANTSSKNCNACHKDPHSGNFGTNCASCHQTNSFQDIKETGFNHNLTGFALQGAHKSIDCRACHSSGPAAKHKEFSKIAKIECLTCHKDPHDKKFGTNCSECHNQNSFSVSTKNLGVFDHNQTGFVLEGKHQLLECRNCHSSGSMTKALPHDQCKDCHKDYHQGDFKLSTYTDCKSCHTVDGFSPSLYTLDKHQEGVFPLTGAHQATPCLACHKENNGQWKFRNIGTRCMDCHENIHAGKLDQKFMPDNNCAICHKTAQWSAVTFDHNTTSFSLIGKHSIITCSSCHFSEDTQHVITQRFNGLPQQCTHCHDNIHGSQFEIESTTDCKRCHSFDNWQASNFNHDNARFQLTGAHQKVACNECHKPELIQGQNQVVYRNNKLECIACHQ